MKFNNKTYDLLKYVCLIGLPAVAVFVAAFGAIWGLPYTDEIVKTIVAINVLMSSLIVVKGVQYNNSDARYDGTAMVQVTPEGQEDFISDINFDNKTRGDVTTQKELRLRVERRENTP